MTDVRKATGEIEPFSEEKVRESIRRAGISDNLSNLVLAHVKSKLYQGIHSADIYHHITEFLSHSEQPYSRARYSLKQAIMQLGPSGYPFEDYIGAILKSRGYTTELRVILQGKCITHEVDVLATQNNQRIMVEAKFHNNPGNRTEVHVALYTHSRFNDVKDKYGLDKAWVVTNTKATIDAITYAQCVGMHVLSWSYPEGESIRDMVEKAHLHPITTLSTLTFAQKQELLNNHIVLCQDLCTRSELLDILHIPPEQKKRIMEEANVACSL